MDLEPVPVAIVAGWFIAGLIVGAMVSRFLARRKGLKGQVRKMKWVARRDWFLSDDHEWRLPNLVVGFVTANLIAGTWLAFYATGLSSLTAAAYASFLTAVWIGLGFGIMFGLRSEM